MADPAVPDRLLAGCRDLLESALAEAEASWGRFDLPLERFASRAAALVASRLERAGVEATAGEAREVLRRTARADLALAIACEEGVPGAWEALVAGLLPRLAGLARKRGLSQADAEALASDVVSDLSLPAAWSRSRT